MIDIEDLKKDQTELQKLYQNAQIQMWRYDGALSYIVDNIKKIETKTKEEEDVRERTD